uniref:Uncharacterized protein LOC114346386 n=1 Tax=Diabrotica virgifera virgifera TaxID=50390 RepID=A0A6P7GSZ8_DIAVI
MAGKEYQNRTGNNIRARMVRDVTCKCHYKCNTKIEKTQREQMLSEYLSLESERSRWAFIGNSVKRIPVKRRYSGDNNKRAHTLQYTLMCNEHRVQVCKQFFLATYDISSKKVETALKKLTPSGITEIDHRGHKEPPNKKSEDVKNIIRKHIQELPVVDSHYCRSSSKRKYLPSGLSETRIYMDYLEYCKEVNVEPEKFSFYKSVFVSEFNYGFHTPKKDQCDFCTQYKNKSDEDKVKDEEAYKVHLARKEEAREHKKVDKDHAKCDTNFSCFTMDLEKILLTPSLQVGQLYFKKKLKTYNFTIYDLAAGQATNYMWHEGDGKKGASEIATCLWKLLVSLGTKEEVTFYSDTASGQNRNTIVSAMFLRAVEQLPIQTINQKFMESGHSEMECDSVHSTIESRGKQVDVYTPEGWYMVARTAKTSKPYHKVIEMDYSDFLDYKKYSSQIITNKSQAEQGKMRWIKVKWIQYRKSCPKTIYFKYRLNDNEFDSLNIEKRQRRRVPYFEVSRLYLSKPKINKNKLKDLLKLCENGSVPSTYHKFYESLEPEDEDGQEKPDTESDEED